MSAQNLSHPTALVIRYIAVIALGLMLMPVLSMAAQSETQSTCDETAEPVGLAYGDHTVGCVISPPGDIDRFQFAGTAGDQIRINGLSQSINFSPLMEIYDSGFTKITEESCLTTYCSFTLNLILPVTGIYTIFVSDVGNNNPGNYTLQIERIVPTLVSEHMDYDSSSSDTIDPATDVDFYNFNVTAGTQIRFNVLANSINFAPVVEIRDQNGTVVVNGAVDGASCNTTYCSFSVDMAPTLTGTYSLLIYDLNTNNPGSYNVSLQCLFGTCSDATQICGDNCIDVANGPLILDPGGNSQLDTDGDDFGNICDGDLNNDADTNTLDLNLYKLAHRTLAGDANYNVDADFNGDGRINTLDLNIYKRLHRKRPGPSCATP